MAYQNESERVHNQLVVVESGSKNYGPILRDAADNLVLELAIQGSDSIKVTDFREKLDG